MLNSPPVRPSKASRLLYLPAMVMTLAACGGGGGSGVAFIPPPPTLTPSPTPTPTPTPGSVSITAPAPATMPAGSPVLATSGGPTFTSGTSAATQFPLLQTAMVYDETSALADAAVNAAGGTATVQNGSLALNVAAFDRAIVRYSQSGYADLDWTRAGYWTTGGGAWDYDDTVGRHAVFVTGFETPSASVPVSGTANYSGRAEGQVFYPGIASGAARCGCVIEPISGTAAFSANFGTRTLSGTLLMTTQHPWYYDQTIPWNTVAFTSTITGNAFNGTTSVTTAGGSPASLGIGATGTLQGRFFGPAAQEAGAVWTLFDGVKAAIGTFTGKRP